MTKPDINPINPLEDLKIKNVSEIINEVCNKRDIAVVMGNFRPFLNVLHISSDVYRLYNLNGQL